MTEDGSQPHYMNIMVDLSICISSLCFSLSFFRSYPISPGELQLLMVKKRLGANGLEESEIQKVQLRVDINTRPSGSQWSLVAMYATLLSKLVMTLVSKKFGAK